MGARNVVSISGHLAGLVSPPKASLKLQHTGELIGGSRSGENWGLMNLGHFGSIFVEIIRLISNFATTWARLQCCKNEALHCSAQCRLQGRLCSLPG